MSERKLDVNPDVVCDFTDLPFDDNTFSLVIFDPPHLQKVSETAWLYKKYGKLGEDWPKMLHDGFAECMRVLKPDGEFFDMAVHILEEKLFGGKTDER